MRDEMPPEAPLPFASVGPHGHRERMRSRLVSRGPQGLADYELLEMLLFLSIPRRDTKPLAKTVINHFGDLYRSLTGTAAQLRRAGLDPLSIGVIDLVNEAARRLTLPETRSRPLLNDFACLEDYLDLPTRLKRPPQRAVLLLNNRNQLLAEMPFPVAQAAADITKAVARRALQVQASAIILATVRPGPLDADARDRDLTRRIGAMGEALSITLHDHMIFNRDGHDSFKRRGLL